MAYAAYKIVRTIRSRVLRISQDRFKKIYGIAYAAYDKSEQSAVAYREFRKAKFSHRFKKFMTEHTRRITYKQCEQSAVVSRINSFVLHENKYTRRINGANKDEHIFETVGGKSDENIDSDLQYGAGA